VSRDLWERAQRINASRARDSRASPAAERFLLSGLLLCGLCGRSVAYQRTGAYLYLRCAHANPGVADPCPGCHRPAAAVHVFIADQVRAVIADPERHLALLARQSEQPAAVSRLAELEYVLIHRVKAGQAYEYELLYDGEGDGGTPFVLRRIT
jgi:hypothetical protein